MGQTETKPITNDQYSRRYFVSRKKSDYDPYRKKVIIIHGNQAYKPNLGTIDKYTRMTTSISSEEQKVMYGNTYKTIKRAFVKIENKFIGKLNHKTFLTYLMF